MSEDAAIRRLQALLDAMPPVKAIGATVTRCDASGVTLSAPLALNVNDKACAFGGSLASLLTLAAWAALESALHRRGLKAEVYVADSQLTYLAPLYDGLVAEAEAPSDEAMNALLAKLEARGRGGIPLSAVARDAQGQIITTLAGRYAALLPR